MTWCALPGDWWGHETRGHCRPGGVSLGHAAPQHPGSPTGDTAHQWGLRGWVSTSSLQNSTCGVSVQSPHQCCSTCTAVCSPLRRGSQLHRDHGCGSGYSSPQLSLHHQCSRPVPRAVEHQPSSRRPHRSQADFAGMGWLLVLSSFACQLIFPLHPRETQRLWQEESPARISQYLVFSLLFLLLFLELVSPFKESWGGGREASRAP